MLDERVDEVAEHEKDLAFNNKNVYQRIAIIAAGPLANFAFAIFAFYLMFLIGVPSIKPVIGNVEPDSNSYGSKVARRWRIVEVAGTRVRDWQDINMALVGKLVEPSHNSTESQNALIAQFEKEFKLNTQDWSFSPEKISSLASLGITPFSS